MEEKTEPAPLQETPFKANIEKELYTTEVLSKNKIYTLSIIVIDEVIIKFILINKDENYFKFEKELNLEDFKSINKYFKQFDSLNEIENELVSIIKEKNYEIKNENNNEMVIKLKVLARNDNIVNINVQKVKINEKDKINILYNKYEEFKLTTKQNNENLLKLLNEKDIKINYLENEIMTLKDIINKLKDDFENYKIEIDKKFNSFDMHKNNDSNDILKNSNIFKSDKEIKFLLDNVPKGLKNLKLIYNSETDEINEEKFIETYINKNDLLFIVKTDKNNIFGGYAHECFQKENFQKTDLNSFLFNLNNKKIYKSKGKSTSIWRGNNTFTSINFGSGVDFKIYHNFWCTKNRAFPSGFDYNYNRDINPLNNDEFFSICFLEIYQVI